MPQPIPTAIQNLKWDEHNLIVAIAQDAQTGRESCFYRQWQHNDWQIQDPVIKDEQQIYGKNP